MVFTRMVINMSVSPTSGVLTGSVPASQVVPVSTGKINLTEIPAPLLRVCQSFLGLKEGVLLRNCNICFRDLRTVQEVTVLHNQTIIRYSFKRFNYNPLVDISRCLGLGRLGKYLGSTEDYFFGVDPTIEKRGDKHTLPLDVNLLVFRKRDQKLMLRSLEATGVVMLSMHGGSFFYLHADVNQYSRSSGPFNLMSCSIKTLLNSNESIISISRKINGSPLSFKNYDRTRYLDAFNYMSHSLSSLHGHVICCWYDATSVAITIIDHQGKCRFKMLSRLETPGDSIKHARVEDDGDTLSLLRGPLGGSYQEVNLTSLLKQTDEIVFADKPSIIERTGSRAWDSHMGEEGGGAALAAYKHNWRFSSYKLGQMQLMLTPSVATTERHLRNFSAKDSPEIESCEDGFLVKISHRMDDSTDRITWLFLSITEDLRLYPHTVSDIDTYDFNYEIPVATSWQVPAKQESERKAQADQVTQPAQVAVSSQGLPAGLMTKPKDRNCIVM